MKAPSRIVLLLLATGCFEPVLRVHGTVRATPDTCAEGAGGDVSAAGRPLVDASVVVRCAAHDHRLAQTDAGGRFYYDDVAVLDRTCALVVDAPGYWPQSFAVADLCPASPDDFCHFVSVHAELAPRLTTKNP